MFFVIAAAALIAQVPERDAAFEPTQDCYEIWADSEGEMARAADPAWRQKTAGSLKRLRAANDRRRARLDVKLARNAARRDRLQHSVDSHTIAEEDFTAARSEIESEARQLTVERDTMQIPACGFRAVDCIAACDPRAA